MRRPNSSYLLVHRPSLVRRPGERHEALETWGAVNSVAMAVGIIWVLVLMRRGRGSWKDLFDPVQQARPMQPLGEGLRTVSACLGVRNIPR